MCLRPQRGSEVIRCLFSDNIRCHYVLPRYVVWENSSDFNGEAISHQGDRQGTSVLLDMEPPMLHNQGTGTVQLSKYALLK